MISAGLMISSESTERERHIERKGLILGRMSAGGRRRKEVGGRDVFIPSP